MNTLLCFFGFLLLLCSCGATAQGKFKNTNSCPKKYELDLSGWLNVTKEDGTEFCSSPCANQTSSVLDCIRDTQRDFWFANKATVQHLRQTIHQGCHTNQGFTGVSLYPSSMN
nr:keratin, type I cytoskeletal 9-like [Ipomoea batatas]GME12088.1 keratin, type I cytoskeletal 9-like [Ipomoea batatas]GME18705.1 keratin, type I cytoskeletal 9-like [Ipomoea batatas]